MIVRVSVPFRVIQCQLKSAGPRNWVSYHSVSVNVCMCVCVGVCECVCVCQHNVPVSDVFLFY